MKRPAVFIFISLLLLVAAISAYPRKSNTPDGELILAYCPTMESISKMLYSGDRKIILLEKASAADALLSLRDGEADIILIGRKASLHERGQARERIIGEGYTLITQTKRFVQRGDLPSMRIHTAIDEEIAKRLLPGSEIISHDTLSDALKEGISEGVLIDWEDYDDRYDLMVVMDNYQKAMDFRIPVLYSLTYDPGLIVVDA